MKSSTRICAMMGLLTLFMQSACVKKVAPVTGSAGLDGESSFVESERPSDSPFISEDDGGLREEAIREEEVFQAPVEEIKTEPVFPAELGDIFFDYDRANLTAEAERTLRQNGKHLMEYPKTRIRISGHTDERGSNEYNLALGARRARTVKQFLEAFGVDPGRIEMISYGEEKPFCHESRESCYRLNRRAHFFVKPQG